MTSLWLFNSLKLYAETTKNRDPNSTQTWNLSNISLSCLATWEATFIPNLLHWHCVKRVRIQSYSGPHFPAFGLNAERCGVSLCIQSECRKMRTRITQNTDPFHVVWESSLVLLVANRTCIRILWPELSENIYFTLYTSTDDSSFYRKCSFGSKRLVLSKKSTNKHSSFFSQMQI